jgi:imidazolonepropionase-like amidohydrolase
MPTRPARPFLPQAALALALLPGLAAAADPAPRPVVLRAARLYDGKTGRLATPGLVVIQGDRIVAVGPGAASPPGAATIDLGDATLMPGLIDAHTHVTSQLQDDWRQGELDALKKPIPQLALEASVHARATLEAGVTTVRDVGSGDLLDVGLRNAIAAGTVPGPRMLVAVNAIGATGGHCDVTGYRPGALGHDAADGVADGPDAVRAMVRKQVKLGADVIKICASGGVLSEGDSVDAPQMTQAEMEAAVDEAHALGKRVAAHCHGAAAAKRAVRAGVDSIEHGTFLDDEALDLMRARGTTLVPTLYTVVSTRKLEGAGAPAAVVAKARRAGAAIQRTFRRAVEKGVRIGFGTDAGVFPHGQNARELSFMVEWGMSPADALHAATGANAVLLGIAAEVGTLEPGKRADVIAVPGDPLKDVRAVERVLLVVKGGAVVRDARGAPAPAAQVGMK